MAVTLVFDRYYVYGKTDCGKSRDVNEDSILINPSAGIVLLADGMGGHHYGDKASYAATQLIDQLLRQYLPHEDKPIQSGFWHKISRLLHQSTPDDQLPLLETQREIITDILIQTNQAIYRQNQDAHLSDKTAMGTTLVGCKFSTLPGKMHAFHVGDSRLYRWRDHRLTQLTKDHSAYQAWQDNGGVGDAPRSNIITQGIGPKPEVAPAVQILDIAANDGFLLCSDGLTDMVEEAVIANIIQGINKNNITHKTQQLIDLANQNGGSDNISVILVCQ